MSLERNGEFKDDPSREHGEGADKFWREFDHGKSSESVRRVEREVQQAGNEGLRRELREKLLEWDALRMLAPAEFPEKGPLGLLGAAAGCLLDSDGKGDRVMRLESAIHYLSDVTGLLKKELGQINPPDSGQ